MTKGCTATSAPSERGHQCKNGRHGNANPVRNRRTYDSKPSHPSCRHCLARRIVQAMLRPMKLLNRALSKQSSDRVESPVKHPLQRCSSSPITALPTSHRAAISARKSRLFLYSKAAKCGLGYSALKCADRFVDVYTRDLVKEV